MERLSAVRILNGWLLCRASRTTSVVIVVTIAPVGSLAKPTEGTYPHRVPRNFQQAAYSVLALRIRYTYKARGKVGTGIPACPAPADWSARNGRLTCHGRNQPARS